MKIENLSEVGMIGDSISDYLGSDIAKHYAVGNASSQYKKKCNYVAENELAKGVAEILQGIIKAMK